MTELATREVPRSEWPRPEWLWKRYTRKHLVDCYFQDVDGDEFCFCIAGYPGHLEMFVEGDGEWVQCGDFGGDRIADLIRRAEQLRHVFSQTAQCVGDQASTIMRMAEENERLLGAIQRAVDRLAEPCLIDDSYEVRAELELVLIQTSLRRDRSQLSCDPAADGNSA